MKRIPFYILLVTTAAVTFSCKKEVPISDSLTGTWELSADFSGWGGSHTHKPGNDTLLVLTSGTYSFSQKGTVVRSGNYTTKKDTIHIYNQLGNRIIFDADDPNYVHEFFTVQNNELNMFDDAWDGSGTTYRRIK